MCINPNIVNFLRDALSLKEKQYGRIIALLIVANIFLVFFSFYTRSKIENIRLQFDGFVRSIARSGFEKNGEVFKKIKPIMVLIPAYNEAENLRDVLPRILKRIDAHEVGVLLIDDGSEDNTAEVALEHGVLVISSPINRGGGAALRAGYDVLKSAGTDICVTMDADGQHQPEEMEKLVRPITEGRYDLVIGSRVLGCSEKDSYFRLIGVYFFSFVISILLGKKITDPSSGFRAYAMDGLEDMNFYEDQYHTSELIINAVRKGKRIGEVPIAIRRRRFGKSKKGKDWVYGLNFARTIIKTWWR